MPGPILPWSIMPTPVPIMPTVPIPIADMSSSATLTFDCAKALIERFVTVSATTTLIKIFLGTISSHSEMTGRHYVPSYAKPLDKIPRGRDCRYTYRRIPSPFWTCSKGAAHEGMEIKLPNCRPDNRGPVNNSPSTIVSVLPTIARPSLVGMVSTMGGRLKLILADFQPALIRNAGQPSDPAALRGRQGTPRRSSRPSSQTRKPARSAMG